MGIMDWYSWLPLVHLLLICLVTTFQPVLQSSQVLADTPLPVMQMMYAT